VISYATRTELGAYLEDGLPAGFSDDYLDRVLELASRDVDEYAGGFPYLGGPLKFITDADPLTWNTSLLDLHTNAIVAATCAQAEYRLAKGDQFFVEAQLPTTDFTTGQQMIEPRFGPKAREELRRAGIQFRATTAVIGP
jgi:hypothetical protein